jgi:nucleotide-binding universal stress UspA family protein
MKTISFNKILATTDYTQSAENAVNTAAAICQKQKANLILLHVVKNAPVDRSPEEYHLVLDYTKEVKIVAKSQLRHLGDQIRDKYKIPVDEIVSYGDVVKEIVKIIHENNPDLVLIGTHGASGFRRFFIGSTAYRVIKHTKFPVMTIPGAGDWTTFRNILLPIRLIPHALDKYSHIRPIIQKDNSILHLLGLSLEAKVDTMNEVLDLEKKMERQLNEDQVTYDVTFHHCTDYADTILEEADKKKADLIVINSIVDSPYRDFFIGPFSQRIINHARVPVLTIRSE